MAEKEAGKTIEPEKCKPAQTTSCDEILATTKVPQLEPEIEVKFYTFKTVENVEKY